MYLDAGVVDVIKLIWLSIPHLPLIPSGSQFMDKGQVNTEK